MIWVNEQGRIVLEDRVLSPDEEDMFTQSVQALANSYALRFIRNQVARECIKIGVYQAMNEDQIMFAKAALWYQQEEAKLLARLINR